MCYAIPGKVVETREKIVILDYFGEKRKAVNMLKDIEEGDYVYAQGGILIDKISKEEAKEVLEFWKDKFFELKKVDKELSKVEDIKVSENLLEILQKINTGGELTREEISFLLKLDDKNELKLLYEFSNNLRQKEHENACCVHGIIEFSNYCNKDCHYCGIRSSRKIERYRITPEEIISTARNAVKELGFKALVLQSGEDMWYTEEKLVEIVKELRKLGILIFLSIGIRSKETYNRLYEAGAQAILFRFETSNKETFKKLRPGTDFEERVELIKWLKESGFLIATGFLIGLPEETNEDIINNILLTKELKADMYSFGPLIPCEATPLENRKPVSKDLMLKIIAISRLVDPQSKILVTSALETLAPKARKQGLLAGANSLMINLTPKEFKEKYTLYHGRPDKDKEIKTNIEETIDLLYSIGRAPTDIGI